MKNLKDVLVESILDDIESTMDNGANNIIIDMLFNKDMNKKRHGFEQLLLLVESYRPKQHKNTAKMKDSDSYFVEFTRPIKIENGELTNEILDWIGYIQICKRIGSDYRTICFNASDTRQVDYTHVINWNYTRLNFNPKAGNTKLYEVPEELNGLFERIEKEASRRI